MINIVKQKTIQQIVEKQLCTGCGTCQAICPRNALTVSECQATGTYLPQLDASKCNQCGLCLKVCPGIEANFNEAYLDVFDQKLEHTFVGNYLNSYSGYATDEDIRYSSTSGGLITALSIFALETGAADGILASRTSVEDPLKPKPFIARNKQDVLSALGSKYCPVPTNLALKEIVEEPGNYIAVGLPCHIQGLRKAQTYNKKLNSRISLVFGIVCNHTPTLFATKYLLRRHKISEEEIAKLEYRGKGWPGKLRVLMNDGSKYSIPFDSTYYWGMVFQRFFWTERCMVCGDKLCQLADIIFMDAWLPKFSSDKIGTSLILTRTKKGEEFIAKAIEQKVVKLQKASLEDVLKSQRAQHSALRAAARRKALKYPLKNTFTYQGVEPKPTVFDLIDIYHLIFVNKLGKNNSTLSQLIIEFHVKLWDIVRLSKRTFTRA